MMLYSIPILVPIARISDIFATHGVMTEMNAPEKKPYVAAKSMREMMDLEKSQNSREVKPQRNAEGVRMLKCPIASETYAGAIRPNTPPAFIAASV
jgi:hypothetical protein